MKTIEDAYKALKGDLSNSYIPAKTDEYLWWCGGAGHYVCTKSNLPLGRQYICTVEEFNNYKGDAVKDKMIKFDLEKALAGEKVVTRDGREVTQIHKFDISDDNPIFGVISDKVFSYVDTGEYHHDKRESAHDLFMAPKKLSGFVNVYSDGRHGTVHKTNLAADDWAEEMPRDIIRLACIDLSQYEEGYGF